jgi:DNA-binding transcriptional LysR family regulator
LAKHGVPRTPEDLARHRLIAFQGIHSHRHLAFRHGNRLKSVGATPQLVVNTADSAIAAAIQGFGLTRALAYQVDDALRTDQLRVILAPFEPVPSPVHLVHAEPRKPKARVRLFVELAATRLRPLLSQLHAGV